MGTVFIGVDESLERLVAVKFLLPELQRDPEMVERFRTEALACASVSHENVVSIYSRGRHGSTDYFISEYVDGFSLQQLIEAGRTRSEALPVSCAVSILEQVCAGLAAVHAAGVVHRDVKPGNIMIEADTGRVVIMDFGIGGPPRSEPTSDAPRCAGGTPAYMAPETIGDVPVPAGCEHLADIYAMGVTIFETLTGRLPFDSECWVDLLYRHLTEAPPAVSAHRAELGSHFDGLVRTCMAKRPVERFGTAAALGRELDDALEAYLCEWRETAAVTRSDTDTVRALLAGQDERTSKRSPLIVVAARDPELVTVVNEIARRRWPRADVRGCRTTLKAVSMARRGRARLVVARLEGSELNGLELAASFRGDPELRTAKLVLVTDSISAEELRLIEEHGASVLQLREGGADVLRTLDAVVAALAS